MAAAPYNRYPYIITFEWTHFYEYNFDLIEKSFRKHHHQSFSALKVGSTSRNELTIKTDQPTVALLAILLKMRIY